MRTIRLARRLGGGSRLRRSWRSGLFRRLAVPGFMLSRRIGHPLRMDFAYRRSSGTCEFSSRALWGFGGGAFAGAALPNVALGDGGQCGRGRALGHCLRPVALMARARRPASWAVGGVALCRAALLGPALLRRDPQWGLGALLLLFATVWATDIFAFFCGRAAWRSTVVATHQSEKDLVGRPRGTGRGGSGRPRGRLYGRCRQAGDHRGHDAVVVRPGASRRFA